MKLMTWIAVLLLLGARTAAAHDDSMDGPIVRAARTALSTGNVNAILIWVKPEFEDSLRAAFTKTMKVRVLDKDAAEMADLFLFETAVRLHRQGEGIPFSGLKPAGYYEGILKVADRELSADGMDELNTLPVLVTHQLYQLYKDAQNARPYSPLDLKGGRYYAEKYEAYMHFVEKMYDLLTSDTKAHATFR